MPVYNPLELLRAPVGNNLENRPKDVLSTKRKFAAEGRYKSPIENGYIDEELDKSIWSFQRENNLKTDGYMNPGGETEAALLSKLLKLPEAEKPEKEKENFQQTSGVLLRSVPLFAVLAAGLGMNKTEEAEEWWKDRSSDERETITRSLDHVLNSDPNKDPKLECDEQYEKNLKKCEEIFRAHGSDAYKICKETAMIQYSQCLADKPLEQRRRLQLPSD